VGDLANVVGDLPGYFPRLVGRKQVQNLNERSSILRDDKVGNANEMMGIVRYNINVKEPPLH
jgi:hypothetical protein